ncbi:glycosyltransferase [Flavobacterium amniphilum]|uniref:glycosyltransferase n=1 Tax=Flavobacterium amniphilum TaxID=1834035 RepID=UPI002029C743|nr:glycosyltransferase [Flavobacterium amniphilum]MCL9805621.1 glycosyltransferase [Flavobacterium amniphilum]
MINTRSKYKIALVGYSLNQGGLEKVMSTLSVYFGSKDIDVHNILLTNDVGYPYGGKLVFIQKNTKGSFLGKLANFYRFYNYLRDEKFDYIIDFRYRINPVSEVLISKVIYNTKVIYSVQSSKIDTYVPNNRLLSKFIFGNQKFVCGSKGIQNEFEKRHDFKNVQTIYNPISLPKDFNESDEDSNLGFKYIISVGRFESQNIKQFDKLIETYLRSELPERNIHLVLLGDGETKEKLQDLFKNYENIHFPGFRKNPYLYMQGAQFLVLCSKYEGFGMVLVEALVTGTPVVSFDCYTGPNEIIQPGYNGILVDNQNFDELRKAMNDLSANEELLSLFRKNAQKSIVKFQTETIGNQWLQLMKIT